MTLSPHAQFFQHYLQQSLTDWQQQIGQAAFSFEADWSAVLKTLALATRYAELEPLILTLTNQFAPHMERSGYWADWQITLQRLDNFTQDKSAKIQLAILQARLYQRQGEFKASIKAYKQIIRQARQVGDDYSRARASSNLAYLYLERAQYWRAEILACHALRIFEQFASPHGLAHTHNHLGILYTRWQRYDLAESHLQQAQMLWQTMAEAHNLMWVGGNLGILYLEMKCYDKAIIELHQATIWAEQLEARIELAKIQVDLGVAYYFKQDFEMAHKYTYQAQIIFQKYTHQVGLAEVWQNLGLIYLAQNQQSIAQSYFQSSLNHWYKIGNEQRINEVKNYLVESSDDLQSSDDSLRNS